MKKLIVVVVVLLLISMVTYGENWTGCNPHCIRTIGDVDNVGIGMCPSYNLDVNGVIRTKNFRMTSGAVKDYVLTCNGSGGAASWKQAPSGGGGSCLWDAGLGGIHYNGGSVGIFNLGNNDGVSILAISENTNTLDEFVFEGDFAGSGETGNVLKLETHWADNVMAWRGDGNVGIGIANPEEKLEVNGIVQMNGFKLTAGSPEEGDVLTYNETSGEGEWRTVTGGGGSCLWDGDLSETYYMGNVGIGETEPGEKLTVNGNIKIKGINRKIIADGGLTIVGYSGSYDPAVLKLDQASNAYLYGGNGGGGPNNIHDVILAHTGSQAWGNVGIGTDIPDERLHVNGNSIISGNVGIGTTTLNERLQVNGNSIISGNVGIGTTTLDYKLNVNGTIRAKEIKVEADWSDFVFADNYKLMSLDKLENHIKANRSLPGIPTEKEVQENGVEVGEMQAKLLEKVEELTLYVIELKKEIEDLKEENEKLEKNN